MTRFIHARLTAAVATLPVVLPLTSRADTRAAPEIGSGAVTFLDD